MEPENGPLGRGDSVFGSHHFQIRCEISEVYRFCLGFSSAQVPGAKQLPGIKLQGSGQWRASQKQEPPKKKRQPVRLDFCVFWVAHFFFRILGFIKDSREENLTFDIRLNLLICQNVDEIQMSNSPCFVIVFW